MILTSPSLLVEGVRSGSRRRNAATASSLVGGVPGRNRSAQRPDERAPRYRPGMRSLSDKNVGFGVAKRKADIVRTGLVELRMPQRLTLVFNIFYAMTIF